MNQEVLSLKETQLLVRPFRVYGTLESTLFLAKDIADVIGATNVSDIASRVDDEENLLSLQTISGQNMQWT